MADITAILNDLPVADLAKRVGASPDDVQRALGDLLPSLVGGMQANAQAPSGAASLTSALEQHIDGAQRVDDVDEADGEKIAAHVFGGEQDAVVAKVAEHSGNDKGLIQKLLPIVAPLVMAWLASRFAKGSGTKEASGGTAGGGLGDLLGQMLGGGSSSSGGGFGNILDSLGGLLGGGRK
ncbi:DUF937 domain-containing protein [Gulosibacter faecalis]|uniref:DUF937 domain-containing protein n=1 Tax=Gulosibacter faecalis TaxID=272240 RepID=A0ABW5UVT8_9MICO|nr:DUF937 domain-containing protein [Gulosibacter faecalis]